MDKKAILQNMFNNAIDPDAGKNIIRGDTNAVRDSKIFVQNDIVTPNYFTVMKKIKSLQDIINDQILNPGKQFQGWRVNVVTWADVDKKTYMCWGDYWVKIKLVEELEKLGCITDVEMEEADVTIYLFGSPFNYRNVRPYMYNPLSFNVVWFYSHPEKFSQQEMAKYDYIFCLSQEYLPKIKDLHPYVHNKALLSCTNFVQPRQLEYGDHRDLVIVANARGAGAPYGREVIKFLKAINVESKFNLSVSVWGHKWDMFEKYYEFPKHWYIDKYWKYDDLDKLYRTAKAVLIDGHETMEDLGFVPMKLFDVFGSGGLPIIQYNVGIEKIFGKNIVLQYKSAAELSQCLSVLSNKEECKRRINLGKKVAMKHKFEHRVLTILNTIKDFVFELDQIRTESINAVTVPKRNGGRKIEWVED